MIEFTQLEFLISRRIEYLYYETSAEMRRFNSSHGRCSRSLVSIPGLHFDLLDFNDFLDSPDCLADL